MEKMGSAVSWYTNTLGVGVGVQARLEVVAMTEMGKCGVDRCGE